MREMPENPPLQPVELDWSDKVSVMNLTLFLVIVIGLVGILGIAVFKPDVLNDPAVASLITYVEQIVLAAFGALVGITAYQAGIKGARR